MSRICLRLIKKGLLKVLKLEIKTLQIKYKKKKSQNQKIKAQNILKTRRIIKK